MIHLKVVREELTRKSTVGKLYYRRSETEDWTWLCWTLEDVVREVEGQPVSVWKVPGETAIPYGTYAVILAMSPRFGKLLPRLVGVISFDGVLFHGGNDAGDTHGCILVAHLHPGPDVIQGNCVSELIALIQGAGGTATVTITSKGAPNDD